jgi:phage/plasmid-associated DNA primase
MLWTYWGKDSDYAEKVQGLREAMAATIFGVATDYQRAFCLYGVKYAGKTQILNIMQGLMPKGTACSVTPDKFGEKFESTELAGKLLNYAGEMSGRNKINGAIFKMIIEGSQIQGQFKNKPVFAYHPVAAHWFGTNHLPQVDEMDGGFSRRWLFFKFDHPLDPKMAVDRIAERVVQEEASAVMAWAVAGILSLRANKGYTESKGHFECKRDTETHGDSVLFWLGRLREQSRVRYGAAEHTTSIKKFTSVEDLFRAYRLFCSSQGSVRHVSLQNFIERMKEHAISYKFVPMRGLEGGVTAFSLITLVESPGVST